MYCESTFFGKTKNKENVEQITLHNDNHVSVSIISYGATITSVSYPDSFGHVENVLLGFNKLMDYEGDHPYLGSTVGRYANRIAKGKFTLNGKEYKLAVNNGPNHLHGGLKGFDKKVFKTSIDKNGDICRVMMSAESDAGDEGYPGKLILTVTYSLNNNNELIINYKAMSDEKTVINITNHAYWNLKGAGKGSIHGHLLYINANHYLPIDEVQIPTGEIREVEGTPFHFLNAKPIGLNIAEVNGFDHCYVLNNDRGSRMIHAATAIDPESGRRLEVFTDQPGVQLYTGNFLENVKTMNGTVNKQEAFCLETQNFPDSPNQKHFPSCILDPGQPFNKTTILKFGAENKY